MRTAGTARRMTGLAGPRGRPGAGRPVPRAVRSRARKPAVRRPATPAAAAPVTVGSSTHVIAVGGVSRSYIVYRPARRCPPPLRWSSCCTAASARAQPGAEVLRLGRRGGPRPLPRRLPGRPEPGLEHRRRLLRHARPGRRRRHRLHHRHGRRHRARSPGQRRPRLRHRHQQRRHHGLRPRLPHHDLRRHRPGLGHRAGRLPKPRARYRSSPSTAPPTRTSPTTAATGDGRSADRRPRRPGRQRPLAGQRPLRGPGGHRSRAR